MEMVCDLRDLNPNCVSLVGSFISIINKPFQSKSAMKS